MHEAIDVAAWRQQKRTELLAARVAIAPEDRTRWNERITQLLQGGFPLLQHMLIGFCWPYKGEPDARFAIHWFRQRGAGSALPVVVSKNAPLEFRRWWPGMPTSPGVFGLPVPQGSKVVVPDAVLVPPVGFGAQGYRLGYGGGYFDRTLASLPVKPLTIGICYEVSRLATIHPQPHDVPMDFIVTEKGVHHVAEGRLQLVEELSTVAALAQQIHAQRHPRFGNSAASAPDAQVADPASSAQAPLPGVMSRQELSALLNTLLEAERAGAKVLSAYLDELPRDDDAWGHLLRIQRDEARNCAVLTGLLLHIGGEPSKATGEFARKALALQGWPQRLEFLNRGQAWVARRIGAALPSIADTRVHDALRVMHESHLANITLCDTLKVA